MKTISITTDGTTAGTSVNGGQIQVKRVDYQQGETEATIKIAMSLNGVMTDSEIKSEAMALLKHIIAHKNEAGFKAKLKALFKI